MTSPVAALVEALERLEKRDGFYSFPGHSDEHCPRCMAARALAAYRARPPLRDVPGLVDAIYRARCGNPSDWERAILDALDVALLGERK